MAARLKERYQKTVIPALAKEFGYGNLMAVPKLQKISLNIGLGEATQNGKLLIEGVGMVKRHTRPNPSRQIKGGIAERESPIAISNVMLLTSGGVATRVGYRVEGTGASSRRVRYARKGGEIMDKKA